MIITNIIFTCNKRKVLREISKMYKERCDTITFSCFNNTFVINEKSIKKDYYKIVSHYNRLGRNVVVSKEIVEVKIDGIYCNGEKKIKLHQRGNQKENKPFLVLDEGCIYSSFIKNH